MSPGNKAPESPQNYDVVIVGGGIAGLYAAYRLLNDHQFAKFYSKIAVFEASPRFGGRISTIRIAKNDKTISVKSHAKGRAKKPHYSQSLKNLEFNAEFGPMRIEPNQQPLLRKLLEDLKIFESDSPNGAEPHLIDFPPYSSPKSEHEPTYVLTKEEAAQETPLDLMRLAFLRILGLMRVDCLTQSERKNLDELEREQCKSKPKDSDVHRYEIFSELLERKKGREGVDQNLETVLKTESEMEADTGRKQKKRRHATGRYSGLLTPKVNNLSSVFRLRWASHFRSLTEDDPQRELDHLLRQVLEQLERDVATHQPDWKQTLTEWINQLTEHDYQLIREYAVIDHTPLYMMGFWNLLSDVLSHDAVNKLRDLGTFYHLIPENPNAVEWFVFWLRGLKSTEHLKGIHGGMECIIDRLRLKVERKHKGMLFANHKLLSMGRAHQRDGETGTSLTFEVDDNSKSTLKHVTAGQVILALPQAPLKEIATANRHVFSERITQALDSVFGFPMVKMFVIVKHRWWESEQRANWYATKVPTRELHYWKSYIEGSKKGMIMVYTDRPASAFWPNYVLTPGRQDEPESGPPHQNPRLAQKVQQYVRANGVGHFESRDIQWYAIRDWGREPFGAACHTWRPERRSWETLAELSAFSLTGPDEKSGSNSRANVHICGEAYSDYHGFIEGALRSVAHVLHSMNPQYPTETPWLCKYHKPPCNCSHECSDRENSTSS